MSGDRQTDAPLADAVRRFLADPGAAFTTPGHKRAPWLIDAFLAEDLPLASGADDARLSRDLLGRAERLAAELWGADACRFALNGSTQGNQALALAAARPGERVAVARIAHKSVFAGLLLAGLEPVWLAPDIDPSTGLSAGLPVREVARALDAGVTAVLLVEPAYTGTVSDLPSICELAHAAGVPVIVDQAWGAHFGFHPELPAHALRAGADAMVISVHKTLASFTQGAMLLAKGTRLDPRRLAAAFELLATTSPSAAILASLDRSRRIMALDGERLLARALRLAEWSRAELSDIAGLHVSDPVRARALPAGHSADPLKVVLSLAGTGADGFAVERDLLGEGVRVEMADRDTLVPLLTIGDDERSVERLVSALRRSLNRRRAAARPVAGSIAWHVRPQTAMSPREAFFAPSQAVRAEEAVGRVSAETVAPYPPGIPVLAPGEIVTAELVAGLRAEARAGTRVAYCSDPTLRTLRVLAAPDGRARST